jgi:sugar O-acyltransferase (sialic acid O-acetyltransferase NeuD family)
MKIIVIGGVGTAVNIAEQIIDAEKRYNSGNELLGFAVDDPAPGENINGYPVLCKPKEINRKFNQKDIRFIYSLYKPEVMEERIMLREGLAIPMNRYATFIHPSVFIAQSVKVGTGNVILSNSTIQQNVCIGNFNILNSNVVVEHETSIGDSNFISASVCIGSKVKIGKGNFIGLNSTLREESELADYIYIGMGSNVLKKYSLPGIYYGNPCRPPK